MSAANHQTVQLRRGKHTSPARGACVIELASMLAGEPFSDHPRTVCPVLAGFLRSYNDLLPERDVDELYPYATLVVGTAASGSVRRARARRLLQWADADKTVRRSRLFCRLRTWDLVVLPAVEAAFRMDRDRRRVEVGRLLDELTAMGAPRTDADHAVPSAVEHADVGGGADGSAWATMRP
jgi:hypothetical protein